MTTFDPNPKESNRSCKKRVRFSEYSQLFVHERRSRDDLKNAWYTKNDVKQFRKDAYMTSVALQGSTTSKAMEYIAKSAARGVSHETIHAQGKELVCGIEHLIHPEIARLMVDRRKNANTRLLALQEEHRKACTHPDFRRYALAKKSMSYSSFSKDWCLQIARWRG